MLHDVTNTNEINTKATMHEYHAKSPTTVKALLSPRGEGAYFV